MHASYCTKQKNMVKFDTIECHNYIFVKERLQRKLPHKYFHSLQIQAKPIDGLKILFIVQYILHTLGSADVGQSLTHLNESKPDVKDINQIWSHNKQRLVNPCLYPGPSNRETKELVVETLDRIPNHRFDLLELPVCTPKPILGKLLAQNTSHRDQQLSPWKQNVTFLQKDI